MTEFPADTNEPPLHRACRMGTLPAFVKSAGLPDVKAFVETSGYGDKTRMPPLLTAAAHNTLHQVRALDLPFDKADLKTCDVGGNTFLHMAMRGGPKALRAGMEMVLAGARDGRLNAPADLLETKNLGGNTFLHLAADTQDSRHLAAAGDGLRRLWDADALTAGQVMHLLSVRAASESSFHIKAGRSSLLSVSGEDSGTFLHTAATHPESLKAAGELLNRLAGWCVSMNGDGSNSKGGPLDGRQISRLIRTEAGNGGAERTPLMVAAREGHIAAAGEMVEAVSGVLRTEDFKKGDELGRTLFHHAAEGECAADLGKAAARFDVGFTRGMLTSPDFMGETPLHRALDHETVEDYSRLVKETTGYVKTDALLREASFSEGSVVSKAFTKGQFPAVAALADSSDPLDYSRLKDGLKAGREPAEAFLYGKNGAPFEQLAAAGAFRKSHDLKDYMDNMPETVRSAFEKTPARMKTYAREKARLARLSAAAGKVRRDR